MSAILNRVLQSLALILWGGTLVAFHASGRMVKYLAPDFRTLALGGGLGLIVLGLFCLLTARRKADCGHDHGPGDAHDHESLDIHPLGAFLIMVAPVALAVVWTTDGYSVAALTRKGLDDSPQESGLFLASTLPPLTKEIIESQHPPDKNGYREFPLLDLYFSSGDPEMIGLVEGMQVVTDGRVVDDPDPHAPAAQRRLYRLFITCCAADSRPIAIIVRFEEPAPEFEENEWVRLSGTITFPDEGEGRQAVLDVDFPEIVPAPPEESFMRGY
ncbi:TIGR03943 family putative permease subunit [Haloferula sargassicola]|uniref:TIGR03943 family protein n=1 Tax=Haloferula sargassicola TaxID=490096 RepID=A0ABP9UPT4_9BACT